MKCKMNFKALKISVASFLLLSLNLILDFADVKSEINEQRAPSTERILYDQRQTGNGYNIHISIKDVAIIAMDQSDSEDSSSNGEDYYYDEDDLTVKPLPSWLFKPPAGEGTTSKPLNTSTNTGINCTNFLETNNTQISSVSNSILPTTITTNTSIQNSTIPSIFEILTDRNSDRPLTNISNSEATTFTTKSNIDNFIKKSNIENNNKNNDQIMTQTEGKRPQYVSRLKNFTGKNLSEGNLLNNKSLQTQNSIPSRNNNILWFSKDTNKIQMPRKNRTHNKSSVAVNHYPIPYHSSSSSLPSSNRQRRCHTHQLVDNGSICQMKRSSSILRRLLRLLMSLPQNDSKINSGIHETA